MTVDILEICRDCAKKLGWVPVPYDVGIWMAQCDCCKKTTWCTAPRDYRMPDGKWVNPEVEAPCTSE